MGKNKVVDMEVEDGETEAAPEEIQTPAELSKNARIRADVAAKIKSKFLGVSSVNGRAEMLDPASTHPGVDYTAGGLLYRYWATDNDSNIHAKRMKGFMMPSEVSSELPDIRRGNQVLMVRSSETDKDFRQSKERESRNFESRVMGKSEAAEKAKGAIGEFEVTPPTKHRE